ncbi:hypothetical protein A6A28_36100 [Streptomyces sp. CB03578]|nr:hypothetical protein A6A28_36100 [Streptomyces sp. CB03578]
MMLGSRPSLALRITMIVMMTVMPPMAGSSGRNGCARLVLNSGSLWMFRGGLVVLPCVGAIDGRGLVEVAATGTCVR